MTTAVQKIVLSSSRDIPFNKLVLSQSNVRGVKAGVSIEDLAASIARRGLIQSLSVFPVIDAEGNATGRFEVPASGRRFRALELLVRQKRLAKVAPVPCIVSERHGGMLAEEVSLAENTSRSAAPPPWLRQGGKDRVRQHLHVSPHWCSPNRPTIAIESRFAFASPRSQQIAIPMWLLHIP